MKSHEKNKVPKYIIYLDAKNVNVSAVACISTARKGTNKQIKGR